MLVLNLIAWLVWTSCLLLSHRILSDEFDSFGRYPNFEWFLTYFQIFDKLLIISIQYEKNTHLLIWCLFSIFDEAVYLWQFLHHKTCENETVSKIFFEALCLLSKAQG